MAVRWQYTVLQGQAWCISFGGNCSGSVLYLTSHALFAVFSSAASKVHLFSAEVGQQSLNHYSMPIMDLTRTHTDTGQD